MWGKRGKSKWGGGVGVWGFGFWVWVRWFDSKKKQHGQVRFRSSANGGTWGCVGIIPPPRNKRVQVISAHPDFSARKSKRQAVPKLLVNRARRRGGIALTDARRNKNTHQGQPSPSKTRSDLTSEEKKPAEAREREKTLSRRGFPPTIVSEERAPRQNAEKKKRRTALAEETLKINQGPESLKEIYQRGDKS